MIISKIRAGLYKNDNQKLFSFIKNSRKKHSRHLSITNDYTRLDTLWQTKDAYKLHNLFPKGQDFKLILGDGSMFEKSFNIKNTQIENSYNANELYIIPNRSYTNPRNTRKSILKKDKKLIAILSQSIYFNDGSSFINKIDSTEANKNYLKNTLYKSKFNFHRRETEFYKSRINNRNANLWKTLILNSQNKTIKKRVNKSFRSELQDTLNRSHNPTR